MCLASTVVASWSLTQKLADSNLFTKMTVMTNIFVTEFVDFVFFVVFFNNGEQIENNVTLFGNG